MAYINIITASGGSVGYITIEHNGSALPQEAILNFVGANFTVTDNPGNGSTDVSVSSSGGATWVEAPASTGMAINTYYNANSGSLVTLTLPSTAAFGTSFAVSAFGAGGFTIAQNAGQTIHFGDLSTTSGTGGSISSARQYDTLFFFCSAANTDFTVTSSIGNLTIV
jgi:hypothetical protein